MYTNIKLPRLLLRHTNERFLCFWPKFISFITLTQKTFHIKIQVQIEARCSFDMREWILVIWSGELKLPDHWSIIVIIITFFNDVANDFVDLSVAYQFECLFIKIVKNYTIFILSLKTKKCNSPIVTNRSFLYRKLSL